jgi:hypothetical protein
MIRPYLDPAALELARNEGREMSLDRLMTEAWAVAQDATLTPAADPLTTPGHG